MKGGKTVSKDLELRENASADLQPIMGPMPYAGGNGSYGGGGNGVPDWMEAEPPYGPTDGFIDTTARIWSLIIRYPRYLALGFLWITYSPWRFGFLAGTVILIIIALTAKS